MKSVSIIICFLSFNICVKSFALNPKESINSGRIQVGKETKDATLIIN